MDRRFLFLSAVPSELQDEARPDGVPGVRFYPQPFSNPSAQLQGSTFRRASTGGSEIPVGYDFQVAHPRDFDRSYMHALYVYGQQLGSRDDPWHNMPPQSQPVNRSASINQRETLLLRCAHCSDVH